MDPEGNPAFYRYWLKGPATGGFWRIARDWSTDPTWVWPTSPADAGTSEIQVQVRDGLHSSPAGWDDDAGALFTVLRPNLPPTLISLKPDKPSSQVAGTPIKWMAVASDPDREPVFYKFWLNGSIHGQCLEGSAGLVDKEPVDLDQHWQRWRCLYRLCLRPGRKA